MISMNTGIDTATTVAEVANGMNGWLWFAALCVLSAFLIWKVSRTSDKETVTAGTLMKENATKPVIKKSAPKKSVKKSTVKSVRKRKTK